MLSDCKRTLRSLTVSRVTAIKLVTFQDNKFSALFRDFVEVSSHMESRYLLYSFRTTKESLDQIKVTGVRQ